MFAVFQPDDLQPTEVYLISVLESLVNQFMNSFYAKQMEYARHTAKILGKLEVYTPEWDDLIARVD